MLGPLLKNYLRLKAVGFILNLTFGKKSTALKGTTKATILTFILEELFTHVFKIKKSKKNTPTLPKKT